MSMIMAEQQNLKSKALGKDCIILLLNLITKYKVIMTKSTNATNNKLKEEAWKSIANEFSAQTREIRRPEQLRLKWENLKKAARKRSAFIRQNNLLTGGGKAFIPPDEVLDYVATTLGTTCSGMTAEFGGDRSTEVINITDQVSTTLKCSDLASSSMSTSEAVIETLELPEHSVQKISGMVDGNVGDGGLETGGGSRPNYRKTYIFNTPTNALNKRRKLSEAVQMAQRDKDLGMAAYFQAKAERVRLDNRKTELENKKMELENIKLELEIKKLQTN